jgi:alpha-beta hydrolase superfamily lysophospholipase
VCAYAALQAPQRYRGVVLASPACDVEWTPVLHVMAAFGSILAACLPNAALVPAIKTPLLSRNPAVLAAHEADELVPKGDVKCRIGNEALVAFRQLKPRYAQFAAPLLVLHGDADKVTSPTAVRACCELRERGSSFNLADAAATVQAHVRRGEQLGQELRVVPGRLPRIVHGAGGDGGEGDGRRNLLDHGARSRGL